MVKVRVKKLNENTVIPSYAHGGDAGFDLSSAYDYVIRSGKREIVKTGFSMEIPEGYFGNIKDRSSVTLKNGVHVLAGVVDSNYRGEVGIVMINLGEEDYEIRVGDRVAQMLLEKVERVEFEEASELEDSLRGTGGFGSSGV